MNSRHTFSNPSIKIYRSAVREPQKQMLHQIVQSICSSLSKNEFKLAQKMCNSNNLKSFKEITRLCQELYLLKYILFEQTEKKNQFKLLNQCHLSEQFQSTLRRAIRYKQSWTNNKKYFQEIDNCAKQLIIQSKFDNKLISSTNGYLLKIKQTLFTINKFISNLKGQISKLKQDSVKLKQDKSKAESYINLLNRLIQKNNQQIKEDRENNLRHVRQKNNIKKDFQNLTQQKLELKAKLEQKKLLQYQLNVQRQNAIKANKQLEVSKKQWQAQTKNYKFQLKQKNDTINSLLKELQCSNEMVLDLQILQRQNQEKIIELLNEVREQESKCQLLKNQLTQNFINHQTQTSSFSQQMADLHMQKQQLTSELIFQHKQKNSLICKIDQIQVQLQIQREKRRSLEQQILILDKQNEKLNNQVNNLTRQLQMLNQEYLQSENLIKTMEIRRKKAQIQVFDQETNTLISLDDLNQIQNKILQDQERINKFEQEITVYNKESSEFQQNQKQNNRKYNQLYNSYMKILKDIDLRQIQRKESFFIGRIIGQQPDSRQYLQSVIQRVQRKTIKKTTLLYQLDPLNKTNFHRYIDDIPNIVVLIKTVTGWVVSGYSEGSFYPKMNSTKNGLIISITGREYFGLKIANKRAIAFDDFFLIFGNSQIRLKSQEFKLFSNFAISASYYDSREHRVQIITGEKGIREVAIQRFQIFGLQFY